MQADQSMALLTPTGFTVWTPRNLCTKMTLHTNSLVHQLDYKFWEAPPPPPGYFSNFNPLGTIF